MQKKIIIAIIIGNIIEWYDFTIYGFLAPILTNVFFPATNNYTALLYLLGSYAVGFVMRPIGSVVLGHYGDKIGRKKIFVLSLIIMTFSTCLIGLIPSYKTIGISAPIILIFCRLWQGFSCGSEFTGSMIFLFEHKPLIKNVAHTTSFAWLGAMMGTLIAAIVSWIISFFSHNILYAWGWRIVFLISIIPAIIGIYFRNSIQETPAFVSIKDKNNIVNWPFIEVVKKHKRKLINVVILNVQLAAFSYIAIAFMTVYLTKIAGQTYKLASLVNMLLCMVVIFFIPVFAKIADKIGGRYFLLASSLGTLLATYPAYLCILKNDMVVILIGAFILGVIGASLMAVIPSIIIEIIPANVRYTGLSGIYNITYCIFGGCGPLIVTYLIHQTGNKMIPCYYIIIASIISIVSILNRDCYNISKIKLFLKPVCYKVNK